MIKFDIVIPTAKGAIIACRFIRDSNINATSTETGVRMGIEKAHRLLGHGDENSTRLTAKKLGWVITPGKLKPCEHCAKAKAKETASKLVFLIFPAACSTYTKIDIFY